MNKEKFATFLLNQFSDQKLKTTPSALANEIEQYLNENVDNIKFTKVGNNKLWFDFFQNKVLIFINTKFKLNEDFTEKKIEIEKKLSNFLSKKYPFLEYILVVAFQGFY